MLTYKKKLILLTTLVMFIVGVVWVENREISTSSEKVMLEGWWIEETMQKDEEEEYVVECPDAIYFHKEGDYLVKNICDILSQSLFAFKERGQWRYDFEKNNLVFKNRKFITPRGVFPIPPLFDVDTRVLSRNIVFLSKARIKLCENNHNDSNCSGVIFEYIGGNSNLASQDNRETFLRRALNGKVDGVIEIWPQSGGGIIFELFSIGKAPEYYFKEIHGAVSINENGEGVYSRGGCELSFTVGDDMFSVADESVSNECSSLSRVILEGEYARFEYP
jgi:hypothetical protein